MNCIECEEIISDYVDGTLELGEQTKIEQHLANCEPCRAVRDDFLQIVHFSKQLPLHTPASDLWTRIQSEIEAEQPKTFWLRAKLWWRNFNARDFNLTIPRLAAVAAAFVLMVSISAAVWRNVHTSNTNAMGLAPMNLDSTQKALLTNPDIDIKAYEQRIDALIESVEQKKGAWAPELRSSFDRNLFYIDQSLNDCQKQWKDNPTDATCRELLKNAYSEKMRLLEGFASFQN
jgi:anti-sigma-K factor RskA